MDFLRDLLKGQPYVALAYMTGILPIRKYGEHSALNMFDEYAMTNQKRLAEFTGFTEEEVQHLCERYQMSFEQTKQWYDGYNINGISIYNPKSVAEAMSEQIFDSYWAQTETYEALKMYIVRNENGLRDKIIRMIAGEHISINTKTFQNDMCTFETADDILTLLVHLGYLTYDFDTKTAWTPNKEVRQEFLRTCLHKKYMWIFEHNFVADKAKIRRRAVARQVFFTQYAAKFAEKTRVYACEDRFSIPSRGKSSKRSTMPFTVPTNSKMYAEGMNDKSQFIIGKALNMEKILEKFIQHFNDVYGNQPDGFKEAEGRKLFMLYLRPIINGTGNYYIEAQTRDQKRTDMIIDYFGQQYVIELKIWHGDEYNTKGEKQIADYLEEYHLEKGYLLSFHFNKNKKTVLKTAVINGKTVIEAVI